MRSNGWTTEGGQLAPWLVVLAASCASAPSAPQPETAPGAVETTTHPRAADRYPLEQCTGEVDGDTRTLRCPEFVLSRTVIDWDSTWTEDLILNTTLATLRQGAETVGTTSDRHVAANLTVQGGRGYAMVLQTGPETAPQVFGMTTYARPLDDKNIVGVICMDLQQTATERCEELSVWFAGELPDIVWTDVSKPTQFAGRPLSAPPGCEVDGDSTITCASGAEVLWFERGPDDPPDAHMAELQVVHHAIVKVNEQRTHTKADATEEEFACHLDGEPAECKLYRYQFTKTAVYVLIGRGLVRDTDVGIICDWTSRLTDEIPIPCSVLVDATPPAAPTREL